MNWSIEYQSILVIMSGAYERDTLEKKVRSDFIVSIGTDPSPPFSVLHQAGRYKSYHIIRRIQANNSRITTLLIAWPIILRI